MKPKTLLLSIFGLILLFTFSSCKKDSENSTGEIDATFDLSGKQAISDNLTDDANNILSETTATTRLDGNKAPITTPQNTICATVTVSPGSFPKTITLDFGSAGCTNPNSNITRRGVITIILSDSFRIPGSTATMTFDNYYVNGYKKEGTIIWTNTSTQGTRSWSRQVVNGKITAPDNTYWLHSGIKNITQLEGLSTPYNLMDDAFSITGTGTVTNAAGLTRQSTIINPVHKAVSCAHADQGTIQFAGPSHTATLDFGSGNCDAIATISIDGYAPRTITLP